MGKVILDKDQVASVATYLQAQAGTVTNGDLISAPAVFQDGTLGQIDLNTATGELTMTRV